MTSQRNTFEDSSSQAGAYLHFQNIQAEDLHLFGVLVDTNRCQVDKSVKRMFKQKHRFITVFAMEEIHNEISTINLGGSGWVDLRMAGDLLYNLALVSTYPEVSINQLVPDAQNTNDTTRFTIKKFCYVTNLGASQVRNCLFNIESTSFDQVYTNNIVILQNLYKRKEQMEYLNNLTGNTRELTTLSSNKKQFKTFTPLKLFFSDSPEKAFPFLRAGQPNIRIQLNLRDANQLVCYTRNLEGQNWSQLIKPTQLGFISTEIFLSEHERIIHANTGASYLIEQNMNAMLQGSFNQLEPSFIHPVKFLYWCIQRKKYTDGSYYLAFDSFTTPQQSYQNFLYDATTRFIMRFAQYKASINYDNVTGYAGTQLSSSTSAILPSEISKADWLSSSGQALLTYKTNIHDVIQSCFYGNTLSQEMNAQNISIDRIFQRIAAQPLIIDNVQKFKKDVGLLIPELLTIEEASLTIRDLQSHVPQGGQQWVALPCINNVANVLFSMFSSGNITVQHGASNQFNTQTLLTYTGNQLFSNIQRSDKFNYGLEDFDIRVYQWDNYGKYLNKTGDSVQITEFQLGATPRFKKSGFYTSQYHQYLYFPGVAPEGVHLYSFSQNPLDIQPSGSLNFTRATCRFKLTLDNDVTGEDQLIFSALVYNVVEFKENTFQLLYVTPVMAI